jgi:hypothetical protein
MSTESMFDAPPHDPVRPRAASADALRDATRDTARAAWDDARDMAREQLHARKRSAAQGLGDLAGALHDAAGRLEHEQQPQIARIAHTAAGSIERVADTLHRKDLDGLVRDAESFARRQPLAFLAGAVAAGFLAVRFLKSSERARDRDERDAGAGDVDRRSAWTEAGDATAVDDAYSAPVRHDAARGFVPAHERAVAGDGPGRFDAAPAPVADLDVDESVGGGAWAEQSRGTPERRGNGSPPPTI